MMLILLIIGVVCLILFIRRNRQKHPKLKVSNYKPDVVYLCQFPSTTVIPSISVFAFKMETWLRFKKIPFESFRHTQNWSKYGMMPFIELNGEQIADSNIIVLELQKRFDKQDNLTKEQQSIACAFIRMLENHTVWTYLYYRFVEKMREFMVCIKFYNLRERFTMAYIMPHYILWKLKQHGIARLPKEEIYKFGFQDIQALSDFLGGKRFFFGDKMTTVDCYVFAHVCEILHNGINYPQLDYIQNNCQNLIDYVERIKVDLWPDWDELCRTRLHNMRESELIG